MMTIGHGTRSAGEFVEALKRCGVRVVVDVRAFPHSRHNPQFGQDALRAMLEREGIAYEWAPALGGRRRPAADSPNVALRHPSFRAYADHMQTDEFRHALDALLATGDEAHLAIMCSESVWWRCHRRLIADAAVLVRGRAVEHIMPDGSLVAHRPTECARVVDGGLRYDGEKKTAD